MSALEILAKLAAIEKPRQLKFGLYKNEGWTTSSSVDVIRLLCDVWNARAELGALAASAMSAGTAETAQQAQGRSPASAVPKADAHPQVQSEQS